MAQPAFTRKQSAVDKPAPATIAPYPAPTARKVGLDVSNPDSHQFLFDNMKIFFYDEGVDLAQIDTSKEGSVNW